jgi:hypothetical protein
MVKRLVLAAVMGMVWGAAASAEQHAVTPEADLVPVATQEICTEIEWGLDGVRTDCRTAVRQAPADNPALKGICTIYYGRRICH